MHMQPVDGIEDRAREVGVQYDQFHHIAGVESAAVCFQVELEARDRQQQVFPPGRIHAGEVIFQVAEFDIEDVCGLNATLDELADIQKGVALPSCHGDIGDAVVQQSLPDQDVED